MELILFAMISLIIIVALLANRLNDTSFPFPFDRKATVFTSAEKNFHRLLEQAVGGEYRVINRVKLSDIVTVRGGVSQRASQTARNKADNKYLDFAICDRQSMKLLGTIDLVDTQGKGYKVKKDWFVSGALEAASIPHLRIKVKATYSVEELKHCLQTRLFANKVMEPKMKGRVIPAPMVKARTKPASSSTGVITPTAALAANQLNNGKLPAPSMGALPH
ncbi:MULTISPECIES: DUF2726 domain-containing protein [Thalassotalea]|uniref:DUF2726 domain-containing protein n=1 Tax=Thalassotalea TaxID=1518149 RepID=UPI000944B03C|nr:MULTISPECIES: DUF2726 domain-containing protein [Thalassotalea]OKY28072.1 hypothetical protein BI291_06110 [Thalassotalea sp. PP2-459]